MSKPPDTTPGILRAPKRPGSMDSMPAVTDQGAELILHRLRETEDRLVHKMDQERVQLRVELHDKIQELEERVLRVETAVVEARGAAVEVRELGANVNTLSDRITKMLTLFGEVANRDANQETRLARLEAAAISAGKEAGGDAGKHEARKWGALGATLGTVLATAGATLLQRCVSM